MKFVVLSATDHRPLPQKYPHVIRNAVSGSISSQRFPLVSTSCPQKFVEVRLLGMSDLAI
jgi:hypothetical protein